MKKQHSLILAAAALLFTACERWTIVDYAYPTYFHLVNQSGHDCALMSDKVSLMAAHGDTCYIGYGNGFDGTDNPKCLLGEGDAQAIFDDYRRIVYTAEPDSVVYRSESNLYNPQNWDYRQRQGDEHARDAYFTLSQEDYATAQSTK